MGSRQVKSRKAIDLREEKTFDVASRLHDGCGLAARLSLQCHLKSTLFVPDYVEVVIIHEISTSSLEF